LLAVLNDLDVKAADIQNTYLTVPITKKYYVKYGHNEGQHAKVVWALYGLPVAGATFRTYLGN